MTRLCTDPLLASLCGKEDPLGRERVRPTGSGQGAGGQEHAQPAGTDARGRRRGRRYKKIVAQEEALEDYFIAEYVRHLPKDTERVTLDLDATDDPLHGQQEGRFFHGYYGDYCYLPLYVF